jgi:hypothetical protein
MLNSVIEKVMAKVMRRTSPSPTFMRPRKRGRVSTWAARSHLRVLPTMGRETGMDVVNSLVIAASGTSARHLLLQLSGTRLPGYPAGLHLLSLAEFFSFRIDDRGVLRL